MDDISDIRDMYDSGPDIEDSRLERHQLERDVTWQYLDAYLPPHGHILEVGMGTGQYTLGLARRGYSIFAVDLSEKLIAVVKERASDAGLSDLIEFQVGDARFLEGIPKNAFDAVLLMGPLYHLTNMEDRKATLKRAFESLKPNGVLFSALLSRFGILGDRLKKAPSWIENQEEVWSIVEQGYNPENPRKGGFRGYYARLDEIAPLHEEIGFQTVTIAGVEPAVSADDERYNNLEGHRRRLWLDLLFRVSGEPSMIASSRHLLYVGKKREKREQDR